MPKTKLSPADEFYIWLEEDQKRLEEDCELHGQRIRDEEVC